MHSRGAVIDDRRRGTAWRTTFVAGWVGLLAACGPQAPSKVATPAELEPSAQRSELCSAANVVGVGLKAQYFRAEGWQGEPMLTRTDASIDFIGTADLPQGLRADAPRSIRWSGWVKAPTAGVYHFHVQPAQARVKISRVDVQAEGTASQGVEMVAGRFYPITVEVDRLEPTQLPVRLEWTAPHGARYVIPRALLNLPTETVAVPKQG